MFPPVGMWDMSAVVEADKKGRILIPAEIRRRYGSNRFKVTMKDDHMELEPLVAVGKLRGKYRTLIKSEWSELEEKGEEFVARGRR
jgi:AbrB family looped-hinge helix DNA binding protein